MSFNNVNNFLGYKKDVFPLQNNPQIPDPSYKMDLDFWDCFRKKNFISKHIFLRLI